MTMTFSLVKDLWTLESGSNLIFMTSSNAYWSVKCIQYISLNTYKKIQDVLAIVNSKIVKQ